MEISKFKILNKSELLTFVRNQPFFFLLSLGDEFLQIVKSLPVLPRQFKGMVSPDKISLNVAPLDGHNEYLKLTKDLDIFLPG